MLSSSVWLTLPAEEHLTTVVVLPDEFRVVKDDRLHYFLLHGNKQAGSAAIVRLPVIKKTRYRGAYQDTLWVDVVFLEAKYRGKNYMRSLLWFVVRDVKQRPLLLDAHNSNISTYLAVGFRAMNEDELQTYSRDIDRHRHHLHYTKPFSEHTPLILT